nr:uncharacterized mitochondrial protein AtMg00810-like [Tanacetum cinerariifolium]
MCTEFEKMMHKKFQMTFMGELTFFLGLQVKQKEDGIFISQDKYVNEISNKFGFYDVKIESTPMETHKTLLKDEKGEDVDEHLYRSMIGSFMYLTSSRPDIMFVVCACVRFQVNPKISHLHVANRIFRYLKSQPKLGLWYPKDSPFDLVEYTDSDYAGASLDKKSTIGGCQFLGCRLISWQCKKQIVVANSITEAEYVAALSCCGQVKNINGDAQLHAKVDEKKVFLSEASIRRDLRFREEGGIDCFSNKFIFEQLTLMGAKTTAWNEFSSTIAFAVICLATDRKFKFSKYIFDSMGRIFDIDDNQDIYLVNAHKDEDIFGVNDQDDTSMFDADKDLQSEEVVENEVVGKYVSAVKEINAACIETTTTATTTPTISMDEITLAKALIEIKTSRPKAKEIVMKVPSETPTPTLIVSSQQPSKVQDIWVNMFVDMDIEVVESTKKDKAETVQESSSKRAGDELE